ncbi:MAG: DUF4391 domain-containing protein [Spirochaeta sp.]|nr:DUF4391 domain-containing protein [Spirochaeta sp.]
MFDRLFELLDLPERSYLGKRVYKRFFHEHAKLGVTDRKALSEDIDTILWQYTLKPSTVPIQPYHDDDREYLEVAVIQINMKNQRRANRITGIVHRAIPYPVILVLVYDTMVLVSLAQKRLSRAESDAIVAEDFADSDWIDLAKTTDTEEQFLDSVNFRRLPATDFFVYYTAFFDRVVALNAARISGRFVAEAIDSKRKHLERYTELNREIAEFRAAIKKEPAFNRQVELNGKIKELEDLREREVQRL